MYPTDKYLLRFEEVDGMLSAQLNYDAWFLLLDVPLCIPWIKDGKCGLLYHSYPKHDGIRKEMDATARENPLVSQLIHKLAHWVELDKDGRLYLPRQAAHFARIHDTAELCRLPNGCVLLQSADPRAENGKAGILIELPR